MPGTGAKPGVLTALVAWLSGRRTTGSRNAAPIAPSSFPRASGGTETAPARELKAMPSSALGLEAQLALGRSRALSARLRSVAAENVPSSLAARKGALRAPAGKAIPKVMPRVLKRYRRAGQAPLISARSRILKLTTLRPSNVIDLVGLLKAFRASWTEPRSKAA